MRRSALALVLVAGATWLSWLVLSVSLASRSLPEAPERSLFWRPGNARALLAEADQTIEEGDLKAATAQVDQALQRAPLLIEALSLRADLAEWDQDEAVADRLVRLGAEMAPQSRSLQSRFILRALQDKQFAAALDSMDALMRIWPLETRSLVSSMQDLMVFPEFRSLLITHLGHAPPWKDEFFKTFIGLSDTETVEKFFSEMQSAGIPPGSVERIAYMNRLIRKNSYDKAKSFWFGSVDGLTELRNGSFEDTPDGSIFDWQYGPVAGAEIRVSEPGDAPSGRALEIVFAGGRVRFQHVIQVLTLPAGVYELQGQAKMADLRTARGLVWRISCRAGGSQVLGGTEMMKGTSPWRAFAVRFTVPASGCPAQELRLSLVAPTVLDQEVSGRIWFDEMSIHPIREGI